MMLKLQKNGNSNIPRELLKKLKMLKLQGEVWGGLAFQLSPANSASLTSLKFPGKC